MLGMSCFVCDFNITVTLRRLVMVLGKSCITIETKEAANIGYNVFFFNMSTPMKAKDCLT